MGSRSNLFQQHRLPRLVEASSEPAEKIDHLTTGELGPERHIPGDIGQPPVQLGGVGPGVTSKQGCCAGIVSDQTEQDADGRGLAGPVGTEEAVNLAGGTSRSSPSRARTFPKFLKFSRPDTEISDMSLQQ